jgi:CheY-like chemotaxis protein
MSSAHLSSSDPVRASDPRGRPLNFLLVEDDEVDVMNVQRAFRKRNIGNPLTVAVDGAEALSILRGESSRSMPKQRRVILLDLNMPRMNGLEFLRELRADETLRHETVVVLTTSEGDQDRIDAYRLNVAGYIVKPVTGEGFMDAMVALNRYWSVSELP